MSSGMSALQRELMLRFMANNRNLAINDKGKITVSNQKKLWNILTTVLNMDSDGQINTLESWTKIWNKWKSDIKLKIRDEKKNLEATGGGSPISIEYEYLDDQLMIFLSKDKNCDLVLPKPKDWEINALKQLMSSEGIIKKSSLTEVGKTKNSKTKDKSDEKIIINDSEDDDVIIVEGDNSREKEHVDNVNLFKEFGLTVHEPSQSNKATNALRQRSKGEKRILNAEKFTEYQRYIIALKQKKLKLMSETLEYQKKMIKCNLAC